MADFSSKHIEVEHLEDVTVVTFLDENLLQSKTNEVLDPILSILDAGHHQLVLDLTRVEVLSSGGVGMLAAVWKYLRETFGENGTGSPTGTALFHLYPDRQSALAIFQEKNSGQEKIILCGANPQVKQILEICRFVPIPGR